jgi:hypothetical protein
MTAALSSYLKMQLRTQATIYRLTHDVTRKQALDHVMRLHAQEHAREQQANPKPAQPKHVDRSSSITEQLIDRFMRLFDAHIRSQPTQQPDPSPPQRTSPAATPEPAPVSTLVGAGSPPQPTLLERLVSFVAGEPIAPSSLPSLDKPYDEKELFVRNSSAVLIPDSEFSPAYQESIATQNWKASITNNVLNFDERRGGPPKKSRYIG